MLNTIQVGSGTGLGKAPMLVCLLSMVLSLLSCGGIIVVVVVVVACSVFSITPFMLVMLGWEDAKVGGGRRGTVVVWVLHQWRGIGHCSSHDEKRPLGCHAHGMRQGNMAVVATITCWHSLAVSGYFQYVFGQGIMPRWPGGHWGEWKVGYLVLDVVPV
jgi:hypothetical protein